MSETLARVAIVTGAGSGIGRAAALALAGDGWSVVLAGRGAAGLEQTARHGQGIGGPLRPVPTDVSDEASVVALFEHARDTFGRVDLLFNNAGRSHPEVPNGSIAAQAPRPLAAGYTASKHGVTGLTKATALEGRGFDIACGQIDIGNAATEMTEGLALAALQPDGSVRPEPRIELDHVTRAILYMASLPLSANVQFMTVMATEMPLLGRG